MMGIQGKTIVFTGKISKPRHEFHRLVEEHGGIAGSDVSKNTDYLVVGEKPGSKLVRASMLGVQTISEEEFLKLLEDDEDSETPLSFAELKELMDRMEERTCYFCKRVYKQFKTTPDYGTCCFCETSYVPKCPNCGCTSPIFVTDFKMYHCIDCWGWFKAPYSWDAQRISHLHYWYKKTETEKGTKEECLCGTIKITKKDGTWIKHEPAYIIEEARKEARAFAVREEREWCKRIAERKQKEKENLKLFESLTKDQRQIIYNQIIEGGQKCSSGKK